MVYFLEIPRRVDKIPPQICLADQSEVIEKGGVFNLPDCKKHAERVLDFKRSGRRCDAKRRRFQEFAVS